MNKLMKWIGGAILALAGLASVPSAHSQQNYNFNVGGLQWASGPAVPGSCTPNGAWFWLNTGSQGWYACVNGAYASSVGSGSITSVTPATGGGLTGGGSSGAVSLGLITTCTTNQILQWNGTAWVCAASAASPAWSSITNPTTNLSLSTALNLTTFTSGDFGASPVTGIHNWTTSSTTTTDTSFEEFINIPSTSSHNPLAASVGGNQLLGVCSTGGGSAPIGFVEIGVFTPSMTCPLLTQSPLSRLWSIAASSGHVAATFYEAAVGYTTNVTQIFAHTVAGTGFNFLATCANANNTGGTCTSYLDTIRGDGLITAPIVNVTTGFQVGGAAPLNHCLIGNGTNYVDSSTCGSGSGFPTGVGIAGAFVSGTGITSAAFLPAVDIQQFFTTPYPTYAQATSQDFGAVMNAALLAATPSGRCVDVSALNVLNAPSIAVYPVTTNMFAGITSNTYVPCIIGANFQLVTGVTQATPAGALKIQGGAPGGIGGTGMVIQECNTTANCVIGSVSVTPFQPATGAGSCSDVGGLNCYATGLPSAPALTSYSTGTVQCTGTTCTGTGTSWTTGHLGNIQVGGTIDSSCPGNVCTIGSTSGYVSGRIVAINTVSQTLTLATAWLGSTAAGQNYVFWNPNSTVAWFDGGLGNSLQKSFTGHQIDNLTIDMNGVAGAGFYTKSSQEGSILNNFTCFMQVGTPTGATGGGTCLAWDQTIREASGSGETFLGHWSVMGGRIGMGANAGGSSAFGVVVEGFSKMDGSVALSQANGPSVFELQADIGGGGSQKFQDGVYLDGFSGMFVAGQHTESVLNDDFNVGPVNPVYNVGFYNITSSGTMGNCVVELHTNTSGNQIHGVSRPSGGCLAADDNLSTPTIGTSISGTPNSWTIPEYVQAGNANVSIVASGNVVVTGTVTANQFQWVGPILISGPIPASVMLPGASSNTAIGVSSDGNLYISNNAAAIDEFATAANTLTLTNKTISGSSNTITNIANTSLTNSTITIAGTSISLGGSTTSFPSPGAIGGTTPAAGTFTTLQANTQINAGSAGTLAPIVMGNAGSGLLTLEPATGAITSYTLQLPVAQPTAGNTFLSCTAASPAVCTWVSSGAGAVALSSVTAATASNTIANGNNPQTWNWAQTANSQTAMSFGETTAATGTTDTEVAISTLSGSTAVPLLVTEGSITSTTAVAALTVNATLNNAGLTETCVICSNVTATAVSGTNSRWLLFNGGVSGNVLEFAIDLSGDVYSNGGTYAGTATSTTATLCGGASAACSVSATGATGMAVVQGQDNTNTGAGVKPGGVIIRGGMTTGTANLAAMEGPTQIGQGYQSGGTVTANLVQCASATQYEVNNCAITPGVNVVGVATNTQATAHAAVGVVAYGQAAITFDGAVTLGDIACLSTTTAGEAHDNGTAACATAGAQLGVIVADSGTITLMSNNSSAVVTLSTTLALVQLHFR